MVIRGVMGLTSLKIKGTVFSAIHGDDGSLEKGNGGGYRSSWISIIQELKILQDKGVNLFFVCIHASLIWKWEGVKMNANGLDQSFRRKPRSGVEESQYNAMVDISQNIQLKPCDDRWVNLVPIKVNVIAWKVMSNALPTRFNISSRGMDIDTMECPICKEGSETSSHLFFQCRVLEHLTRSSSSGGMLFTRFCESYVMGMDNGCVGCVNSGILLRLNGLCKREFFMVYGG
ncbi:RNA-directed DNA polymerase, eukaryota, reverse transcriptase zinc-binding domain protein [Tanacetum coccineum]